MELPNAAIGLLPDHEVNAFGLAGIIVVEQELRILGQDRLAIRVIAISRAAGGADHLLGRNAIYAFGIDPHEILAPTGDDVGLEAIGAQIAQHFLHRLVGEFGIRRFQRPSLASSIHFLASDSNVSTVMPVSVAKRIFSRSVSIALRSPHGHLTEPS